MWNKLFIFWATERQLCVVSQDKLDGLLIPTFYKYKSRSPDFLSLIVSSATRHIRQISLKKVSHPCRRRFFSCLLLCVRKKNTQHITKIVKMNLIRDWGESWESPTRSLIISMNMKQTTKRAWEKREEIPPPFERQSDGKAHTVKIHGAWSRRVIKMKERRNFSSPAEKLRHPSLPRLIFNFFSPRLGEWIMRVCFSCQKRKVSRSCDWRDIFSLHSRIL